MYRAKKGFARVVNLKTAVLFPLMALRFHAPSSGRVLSLALRDDLIETPETRVPSREEMELPPSVGTGSNRIVSGCSVYRTPIRVISYAHPSRLMIDRSLSCGTFNPYECKLSFSVQSCLGASCETLLQRFYTRDTV